MAVVENCLGIPYCSVFPLEERGIWEGDVVVLERLSVFQDACVVRSLSYTGSRKSQGFLGSGLSGINPVNEVGDPSAAREL